MNDAKDEFEVDGATAVYSTWRVETEGIAGPIVLDATMNDERAARLLATLPEGEFILKIKFLMWNQGEGDWVVTDKYDPVRVERKRGMATLKSHETPGLAH